MASYGSAPLGVEDPVVPEVDWGGIETQFMSKLRANPLAAGSPAGLEGLNAGGYNWADLPEASRQRIQGLASSPDFKTGIVDASQTAPPMGAAAAPPPSNQAKVADFATSRLGEASPWSPEQLDKTIEYYTRPAQQRLQETLGGINRQAIAEGNFWSGSRGEALGVEFGKHSRQVAEDVVVPLTAKAIEFNEAAIRGRVADAVLAGRSQAEIDEIIRRGKQEGTESTARMGREEGELLGTYKMPELKLSNFGLDTASFMNPDGSVKDTDAFNSAAETLAASAKDLLGRDLTSDEARTLLKGGTLNDIFVKTAKARELGIAEAELTGEYKGEATLEAKRLFGFDRNVTNADGTVTKEHVYGANELAKMLQDDAQAHEKLLVEGYNHVDPETGEVRRVKGIDERITDEREFQTMTRTGYDEVVKGPDGKPLMHQGKPVLRRIEGTQEASTRIANRELDLQKEGLDASTAHNQAVREQDKREYEGYHRVRTDAAGNPMKDKDGNPIVDYIEGAAGLEASRIQMTKDLQAAGFNQETSERIANQAHEEKIRRGYQTTGPDGQPMWVRGSLDEKAYLLELQSSLNIDEAQAQGIIDEQKRVGYDKVVQIKDKSGRIISTTTVHVEGTQEAADRIAKAERDLTERGWGAQAAREEAARVNDNALKTGGYVMKKGPNGQEILEWVPGDQAHEKAIRDDANALVEKGWEFDAAQDAVRAIRSRATAKSDVIRQDYITQRAWHYMNGPDKLSKDEAHRKAGEDWKTVEGSLGETLEERLSKMSLDAAKARQDDEQQMELLGAALGMLSKAGVALATTGLGGKIFGGFMDLVTGKKKTADHDYSDPQTWIQAGLDVATAGTMAKGFKSVLGLDEEGNLEPLGIDAINEAFNAAGIGPVVPPNNVPPGDVPPADVPPGDTPPLGVVDPVDTGLREGVTFGNMFKGFATGAVIGGVSAWTGDSAAMQRWAAEHPNLAAGKTGAELASAYAMGAKTGGPAGGVFSVGAYIGANYLVKTFKSPGDRSATTASMGQLDPATSRRLMPPELRDKWSSLTERQQHNGFQVAFDWVDGKVYYENSDFKGGRDPNWSEPIDAYMARNQMMIMPVAQDLIDLAPAESKEYAQSFKSVADEMGGAPKGSKYAFIFPDGEVVYRDGRGKVTGKGKLPAKYMPTGNTTADTPLGVEG